MNSKPAADGLQIKARISLGLMRQIQKIIRAERRQGHKTTSSDVLRRALIAHVEAAKLNGKAA
jgi:hypothetical protein